MRLPKLTLFTSGPACSLCTVAKADLQLVQKIIPFELNIYDIRRLPGQDQYDYDRTAWRRLYQYEVPVLHRSENLSFEGLSGRISGSGGGRIMKHRIDKEKLVELIKKWTIELNPAIESVS